VGGYGKRRSLKYKKNEKAALSKSYMVALSGEPSNTSLYNLCRELDRIQRSGKRRGGGVSGTIAMSTTVKTERGKESQKTY